MKTNVGTIDRIVRFLIALAALSLYFSHLFSGIAANVILLFSMIMLLTAYFRSCPLYRLFGLSTYQLEEDFKTMLNNNTLIVDVRQPGEYNAGHIDGSINIPLGELTDNLPKLAGKNVITCCASGARSAAAKNILSAAGIKASNGGGWKSLSEQL